jgi:hypothetical protein
LWRDFEGVEDFAEVSEEWKENKVIGLNTCEEV